MTSAGAGVPRIAALDGEALRRSILAQLQHPELERCLILAYRFNDFDLIAGPRVRNKPTSLLTLLERACRDGVDLTFMSRDPLSERDPQVALVRNWLSSVRRLMAAGAKIRIHPSLHAKVYLFARRGALTMFAVGSSNLTYQGMGYSWAECNVRGFHSAEYDLVLRHAAGLTVQAQVSTLDEWETSFRRAGRADLLRQVYE